MNAKRLLAHYQRIADAPDAIARLRRFILDLAVRGWLVLQDPNDQPKAEFLKRVKVLKSASEPFNLPNSWEWVRVGTIAEARLGKMLDKSKNKGTRRRYLRNINVRWFDFDLSDLFEMRFEDTELSEFALRTGDVLICEGGEPGRAAVWDDREKEVYFQKAIHRVRFPDRVDPSFFVRALRSSADDGRLAAYFTGTGIQHFTGRSLDAYLFPLPPLAEQHRIVAKVDELMALCDQLEAARAEREKTRDRLAASSLARLNAPDPETFQADALFALNVLPALTTRPDQMKQLRQTILNLAVGGKLVPRNPGDEPAIRLLERAKSAKAQAMSARKIRRDSEPELSASAGEGLSPAHWTWSHLYDFALVLGGKRLPAGASFSSERTANIYIRVTDMKGGSISTDRLKYISEDVRRQIAKYTIDRDDLYITIAGTIGDVGVVPDQLHGQNLTENAAKIVFREVDRKFLLLVLRSGDVQRQFQDKIKQMAQPKLALKRISGARIPIPPLAEQHRIVTKVDALMALCDRLEASLNVASATRRRLLDALLQEALAPAERELEAAAE